MKISTKSKK